MCEERKYHYIKLINRADNDIRRKIEKIKSDCPEKILNNAPEIKEECKIFRFARIGREEQDKYPYFISNPQLFRKRSKTERETCMMCGLSVFLSIEDVEKTINQIRQKYPKAKFLILEGYFKPENGVLYLTSTDKKKHCTFFPCENFAHDRCFRLILKLIP